MKRKLFAIGLGLVLLLAGCGGGNSASNGASMSAAGQSAGGDNLLNWNMGAAELDFAEAETLSGGGENGSIYQNTRAKLIRRAELYIQTEQFDQSKAALDRLVAECGGYYERASLYGGGYRDAYANRSGEYTVRVPAEKYSQFLSGAGDLGYVTSRDESSEDVGERYYDTEARLKTQRTKQERLLALLEKAESMEDIIALENALSDVEYQIEQYSSELNRYDALINFSTVQICLNEVNRVTQEVGETASLGQRMAAGFQASVRNFGRGFQELLVWGSYHIFLVIILAGVAAAAVFAGRRELKRRRKQREKGNGQLSDTDNGPKQEQKRS